MSSEIQIPADATVVSTIPADVLKVIRSDNIIVLYDHRCTIPDPENPSAPAPSVDAWIIWGAGSEFSDSNPGRVTIVDSADGSSAGCSTKFLKDYMKDLRDRCHLQKWEAFRTVSKVEPRLLCPKCSSRKESKARFLEPSTELAPAQGTRADSFAKTKEGDSKDL